MNETDTIQYAQIREYNYKEYFHEFQYNEEVISDDERKEFIKEFDAAIAIYSEGLPLLKEGIDSLKGIDDKFYKDYRTLESVYQFIIITTIDCFVISKYFLLADKDYDKRFMRGKMKVILNEGFKKLYGFDERTKKKSEWRKLGGVMEYFPMSYQFEFKQLSYLLDKHSQSSSWWKDERDVEIHLDAEGLYDSRCEDIVESKVMIDAVKLLNTLYAIQLFITNVHAYFHNTMLMNCQNQTTSTP